MVPQSGHSYGVESLSYVPGTSLFASSSMDKTIKLWTLHGALVRTFSGHTGAVFSVSLSRDLSLLASASQDHTVRLWKTDGTLLWSKVGDAKSVYSVAMSPDGTTVLSGSADGSLKMWSLDGTLRKEVKAHAGSVNVAVRSDGRIHTISNDGTMKLWSPAGELIRSIPHGGFASAFSPDGQLLATGSLTDHVVTLWTADGVLVRAFEGHRGRIESVSFSPDGKRIVSASLDETVRVWGVDGAAIATLKADRAFAAFIDPDGQIYSGHGDGKILARTEDGTTVRSFGEPASVVSSVSATPDLRTMVSASNDGGIRLWSHDGSLLRTFWGGLESPFTGGVVAMSPDGQYFVYATKEGLRYVETQSQKSKLLPVKDEAVAFGRSGDSFVTGSGHEVHLWKRDGTLVRTLTLPSTSVVSLALSPDEKLIAVGDQGTLSLVDTHGKGGLFKGLEYMIQGVAFSPDSQQIAGACSDGQVRVWSVGGKKLQTLSGNTNIVYSVAFTPDGKSIAAGGWDNNIRFWSADGKLQRTLAGHSRQVTAIQISADGRAMLSASGDGTIRRWDLTRDQPIVSWIASDDDWAVFTAAGHFEASREGGRLVGMSTGLRGFAIDQFAINYNRPDLILDALGVDAPAEREHFYQQYLRRLRRAGMTQADAGTVLHVPEAKIIKSTQAGKIATIDLEVSDARYPLKSYNLYVNDVPLFGAYGKPIEGKKSATLTEQISLNKGRNKIELTAINTQGAESFRALTYADYRGETVGKLYFIGFGVSKYRDKALNLDFAHKDALDLAATFTRMEKRYGGVKVHTFVDEAVTPASIAAAKGLLAEATVDDTLVLFIAGHGVHEQDSAATYYYLTHGADLKNLTGTAVSFDAIEEILQGVAPRRKLWLMDTCESGEAEPGALAAATSTGATGLIGRGVKRVLNAAAKAPPVRPYLHQRERYIYNDLLRRSGSVVLSSSRGGELSYERADLANGVFTAQLIEALSRGDASGDGAVTVEELRSFVARGVARETRGLQNPTIDRDNISQRVAFPVLTPK